MISNKVPEILVNFTHFNKFVSFMCVAKSDKEKNRFSLIQGLTKLERLKLVITSGQEQLPSSDQTNCSN